MPLRQLQAVLSNETCFERPERTTGSADRLVLIYCAHGDGSWSFGGEEHRAAPAEVQNALNSHEAITYRAPCPGGRLRHEFPAMLAQLLKKLGAA